MYGMVNQAIKDLVKTKFGNEVWEKICIQAQVSTDDFVFMDYYPDKVTYDLVAAVSQNVSLAPEIVLKEFGKFWVLYTAQEGYGPLMDLFGADYKSCLQNLNNLHARMGMSMPHLSPPRFTFREESKTTFLLEYHSNRSGLSPMVQGLLEGLAEKHKVQVKIEYFEKENTKTFRIQILE